MHARQIAFTRGLERQSELLKIDRAISAGVAGVAVRAKTHNRAKTSVRGPDRFRTSCTLLWWRNMARERNTSRIAH